MKIYQPYGEDCPGFFIDDVVKGRLESSKDPELYLYGLWCECKKIIREPEVLRSRTGHLEEFMLDDFQASRTFSVEDLRPWRGESSLEPVALNSNYVNWVEIKRNDGGIVVCAGIPIDDWEAE